jgi:hypothetical protein
LPRCPTKKKILQSIDDAKDNITNCLLPVKNYTWLALAATSLFFKVDIMFTRFLYNQDAPFTTKLESLQDSSETLHICGYENECDEWIFFPMVPPSLVAGYKENLVCFIF